MFDAGETLPQHFYVREEGSDKLKFMCLTDGMRVTRPENERIEPNVRDALVTLADLVEFYKVDSDEGMPCELSNMIESAEAYKKANEARLLEVIEPRLLRLEAWLAKKLPPSKATAKERAQFKSLRRDFAGKAKACVATLRAAGF